MVLIKMVSVIFFIELWIWRAVGLTVLLLVVARPASVLVGLCFSRTSWRIRGLACWFGVRGIGSLYYLMFAIQHGLSDDLSLELIQIALIVITLSILVHGISVKPHSGRYGGRRF